MSQGKFFADRIRQQGRDPAEVAVGIPWYSEDSYDDCVSSFSDSDKLPDTYADWLVSAKELEQSLKDNGFVKVVRAKIDPVEFPRWCADNGHPNVDANARSQYGNHVALQSATRFTTED